MNSLLFLKGLLIGISMAAPIGPISVLCIRRSLTRGHHAGIATALGVALADGFYAMIAAFGLTAISSFLIHNKLYLDLFGGVILIALGIKAYNASPITLAQPIRSSGFFSTLIQTTLLTLANPMTIITFVAAFAAVGFQGKHDFHDALLICLGVFCGSGLWFIALSSIVSHFRHKVTPAILTFINKLSGFFLIVFGAYFLFDALQLGFRYFFRHS